MDVIVNLDKPKGITSQQAVSKVKRIFGTKKAGHAGTLDPIATGILLVCIGEATKITRFLSDLDKEYLAVVKLGEKTDTLDSEGEVIQRVDDFSLNKEDVEKVLPGFIGTIEQTPPMYSAIKMNGKPLYKLARKGITIERPKRTVVIDRIEITGFDLPIMEMRVSCSKGTYIRSLCDDIGTALGVGAHIVGLRRTRIGDFVINDSIAMNSLEESIPGLSSGRESDASRISPLVNIDTALNHFREFSVSEDDYKKTRNGLPLKCPDMSFGHNEYIRLKDPSGDLFAIGKVEHNLIRIERMLHLSSNY